MKSFVVLTLALAATPVAAETSCPNNGPQISNALFGTARPMPSGISPRACTSTTPCPVVKWNGIEYWAFAYNDNRMSTAILGYNSAGKLVRQLEKPGARYITAADATCGTSVAFIGQSSAKITVPWAELDPPLPQVWGLSHDTCSGPTGALVGCPTAGGGTLTIAGANFDSSTQINAAKPGTLMLLDPNHVSVELVAGAATSTLQVFATTDWGKSVDAITLQYGALPTITSLESTACYTGGGTSLAACEPAGGTIAINGTGFTGKVTLEGTACAPETTNVISPTRATCTLVAGTTATPRTVKVRNDNGTSTQSGSIGYLGAPTIATTSCSNNVCNPAQVGQTLSIDGNGFYGTVTTSGLCADTPVVTPTRITCRLGSAPMVNGRATSAPVTLSVATNGGTATKSIQYAVAPSISRIEGTGCVHPYFDQYRQMTDPMVLKGCPTNTVVTITGEGFVPGMIDYNVVCSGSMQIVSYAELRCNIGTRASTAFVFNNAAGSTSQSVYTPPTADTVSGAPTIRQIELPSNQCTEAGGQPGYRGGTTLTNCSTYPPYAPLWIYGTNLANAQIPACGPQQLFMHYGPTGEGVACTFGSNPGPGANYQITASNARGQSSAISITFR